MKAEGSLTLRSSILASKAATLAVCWLIWGWGGRGFRQKEEDCSGPSGVGTKTAWGWTNKGSQGNFKGNKVVDNS